ncbi:toxic anion resistance protein [Peptoniphilus equinus]|uniref:Toxic anion resistance protein n=1 Tax=Peptoniphilus equinus TaxID=3016343 RepID=A0ABY7QV69_9FIRM|nr:toxic anion resistance protein [Peptoniphilus equinus]WBW49979.1 toxic anion resistance protein [Peptoniphilus equinus]
MSDIKLTLTTDPIDTKDSDKESLVAQSETKSELVLSESEQKMVEDFAEKINLSDTTQVLSFGAAAQNKIASFSEKTLASVYTKDLQEVGTLLSGVVNELKRFEIEDEDKGLFKMFKKSADRVTALKTKYQSVEKNVDEVKTTLEAHQVQLLRDIATLDEMYALNSDYFKEISMYILAGEKKLEAARRDLVHLEQEAEASGSPVDAQRLRDQANSINRFEKKLHDLELTKMVSLQMAPQIRMIQSSDSTMLEKIQSTIVNTIPLWKNQMVLALSANHALDAQKAQQEVADYTNKLLRQNADDLKMATINSERASQRGIIDIDTIEYTNARLIEALDEVRTIQREGREQRAQAKITLETIEMKLKRSLLSDK